jgi:excisionase family DNA binding protein
MSNDIADLMTVKEAAQKLGVKPQLVYIMTTRGQLPSVKVRRAVRIDPTDLASFIELNKRRSPLALALTR